jgi:hypothetical protein
MTLGADVFRASATTPPRAHALAVVTSIGDLAVNNRVTAEVVRRWRARGARVSTHEFGSELPLLHDIVDAQHRRARTRVVYPVLLRLIDDDLSS